MHKKTVKVKICGALILPVVLYGYEIGCLTLWKEYGFKVFKNRVLREIHAHNREGINWGWRRLMLSRFMIFIFTKNYLDYQEE